jgi:DNA-binding MarR family transcriptional regulator
MDKRGRANDRYKVNASLRQVLQRAINQNQFLLLTKISCNCSSSISSLLSCASERFGVPLSTLKLNARVLRELGLISFGCASDPKPARLTDAGRAILEMLNCDDKAIT